MNFLIIFCLTCYIGSKEIVAVDCTPDALRVIASHFHKLDERGYLFIFLAVLTTSYIHDSKCRVTKVIYLYTVFNSKIYLSVAPILSADDHKSREGKVYKEKKGNCELYD